MPAYALVLHPTPVAARLPTDFDLPGVLRRIGLIGENWGEQAYLPGADFSRLIVFLGCSPVIRAEPPAPGKAADNFYFLELLSAGAPRFLGGTRARPPRCPACRANLADWQARLAAWAQALPCPRCGTAHPLDQWDWRHCAAFAGAAIVIHGVFEGEAVPGDALLDTLRQHSGAQWGYFYRLPEKPLTPSPSP